MAGYDAMEEIERWSIKRKNHYLSIVSGIHGMDAANTVKGVITVICFISISREIKMAATFIKQKKLQIAA